MQVLCRVVMKMGALQPYIAQNVVDSFSIQNNYFSDNQI